MRKRACRRRWPAGRCSLKSADEESSLMKDSQPKQAKKSALASVGDANFSVADSVGGVRGIIESVLPTLVFMLAFIITSNLWLTVVISVVVGVAELVVRLVERESAQSAVMGLALVLVCLAAAWFSHSAKNFYVPGFIINAVAFVAVAATLLARVPLVGCFVEAFHTPMRSSLGDWARQWRSDERLVKAYAVSTWVWLALFAVRLALELPLYFAGRVAWLGVVRIISGIPLFAAALWISWVLVSPQMRRHDSACRNDSTQENAESMDAALDESDDD